MSRRLDEIDAVRGFAILLVVLGHSITKVPVDLQSNYYLEILSHVITSFHMPLFFFLSGYCFKYVSDYKNRIKNIIIRFGVPYIFYNILDTLPRTILGNGLITETKSLYTSIFDVMFCGGKLWYLYSLAIMLIIYTLWYSLINKSNKIKCFTLLLFIVLAELRINCDLFTINKLTAYSCYFLLGDIVKNLPFNIFEYRNKTIVNISTVCLLVFLVSAAICGNFSMRVGIAVIGIMMSIGCSYNYIFVRLFKYWGKISLQIYMLNSMVIMVSRTVAFRLLGITNPYLTFVFNFICGFCGSWAIFYFIINKSKILRFVYGLKSATPPINLRRDIQT